MSGDVMACPYISQWASQASNRGSDCGQTCVAMLAHWQGVMKAVNEYIYQSDITGMSDAGDLVNNFVYIAGLPASIHTLQPNRPTPPGAICLIQYAIFPIGTGLYHKQDDFSGLHWLIVLKEVPGEYVEVHDPDYYGSRMQEGAHKRYAWSDWLKEITTTRTIVTLDVGITPLEWFNQENPS